MKPSSTSASDTRLGVWPNSVTISSAVSASITSLILCIAPCFISSLMTSTAALGHAVGEILDGDRLGDDHLAHDLVPRLLDAHRLELLALAAALQRGERALALALVEGVGDRELAADAVFVGPCTGLRATLTAHAAALLAARVLLVGDVEHAATAGGATAAARPLRRCGDVLDLLGRLRRLRRRPVGAADDHRPCHADGLEQRVSASCPRRCGIGRGAGRHSVCGRAQRARCRSGGPVAAARRDWRPPGCGWTAAALAADWRAPPASRAVARGCGRSSAAPSAAVGDRRTLDCSADFRLAAAACGRCGRLRSCSCDQPLLGLIMLALARAARSSSIVRTWAAAERLGARGLLAFGQRALLGGCRLSRSRPGRLPGRGFARGRAGRGRTRWRYHLLGDDHFLGTADGPLALLLHHHRLGAAMAEFLLHMAQLDRALQAERLASPHAQCLVGVSFESLMRYPYLTVS